MNLQHFIERLAREAGAITLKYFNKPGLVVDTKANDTPVTQADRESERYLRAKITEAFPKDGIIGEEFGEERPKAARRWILDPLDGTNSFIHGVPLYGTLIALEEGDDVTHGACYLPALNELVYAERGKGCFWNGDSCKVSSVDQLSASTLLTTSERGLTGVLGRERYDTLVRSVQLFRSWGDCYGHVLVATGRAEAMLDPKMAVWDCGPFAVIIEEAGGVVSDLRGNRTIRGGNFVSSNKEISNPLRDFIKTSNTR
ncbi:MAG: inositol monophosphatase family protein [Candidatus Kapaibacterium sp.]|jgi:histidinol-phosphatase